jgi:organic radical activating enzyme
LYNEIETNGTVVIDQPLFDHLEQINCSPKLANSGMTEKQRIVPAAIKRIMEHKNYQFKFVISTEDDVLELFRDFVEPFNIPLKNVVCMPGLDDASNFEERTRFVMEMAKKYRFRGLTRLHIAAWDKTLNV